MDTSGDSGVTIVSDSQYCALWEVGEVPLAPLCEMVSTYVSIRANPAFVPTVFTVEVTDEYSIISSSMMIALVLPAEGDGKIEPLGKSKSISVAPGISELLT